MPLLNEVPHFEWAGEVHDLKVEKGDLKRILGELGDIIDGPDDIDKMIKGMPFMRLMLKKIVSGVDLDKYKTGSNNKMIERLQELQQ